MDTRIRRERDPFNNADERVEVRKWQVEQAKLCKALMDSLVEQVAVHSGKMIGASGNLSQRYFYEQAEGAASRQVKEDVKRLRRELLLLAKSYGWRCGH